jgi:hypothetical protein
MKTAAYIQLGLLLASTVLARAQSATSPPRTTGGPPPQPTNPALILSNRTVLIVSNARGVEAEAVKLKFSDSMSGPFEIAVQGTKDLHREAELLSREFGTNIAVIVDEATLDGRARTNYVFRGGSMRRTVAPIVNNALPPGGRRLYVWPETSGPRVPANVRLVRQAD